MTDPFRLPEPCIVGCSGGRTSGYLLRRVLDSYGGKLPSGIKCVFANTGKERAETLDFVERISIEWDVEIVWLEYRSVYPNHGYEIVNIATASRDGRPFNEMLEHKERYRREKGLPGVLPNPAQRMCTGQLKMRTIYRFVRDVWGVVRVHEYNVALALRSDEQHRIESTRCRAIEAGVPYFPLDDAGIVSADVLAFWRSQPFDLKLKSYQGNCDLCYMKSRASIDRLIRQEPERADWWIEWEKRSGQRFRDDRPRYVGLRWQAEHQGLLFDEPEELETVITCEGGYCSD